MHTGINFKQIISSCPNQISRITEFLVHVISADRSFPECLIVCRPHTPHPAHTGSCSSLPPQHSPLWPAAATNSQLCFSWLLAARELTREPQCSKWCDKKELCRTVFSNDQSDWKRLSSYFSASVERWTSKLLSNFQNPLRIRSKYLNFSNPILYTRVWCHDKAVFLQPLISGLLATLIQI